MIYAIVGIVCFVVGLLFGIGLGARWLGGAIMRPPR